MGKIMVESILHCGEAVARIGPVVGTGLRSTVHSGAMPEGQ